MPRSDSYEIFHILISIATLTFSFSYILAAQFEVVFLTVTLAYFVHEIAHKIAAEMYGVESHYEINYWLLLLSVITTSFFSLPIGVAGSVKYKNLKDGEKAAVISSAGPFANIILAGLFLFTSAPYRDFGFVCNILMASFNILPIGSLDGVWIYKKMPVLWMTLVSLIILNFVVLHLYI